MWVYWIDTKEKSKFSVFYIRIYDFEGGSNPRPSPQEAIFQLTFQTGLFIIMNNLKSQIATSNLKSQIVIPSWR
jgi:hypothetical protein